jgi:hypothetical protein
LLRPAAPAWRPGCIGDDIARCFTKALVARAQQDSRVRRVGVLTGLSQNEGKAALSAFARALAGLGWTVGRNVQVDVRFFGGS